METTLPRGWRLPPPLSRRGFASLSESADDGATCPTFSAVGGRTDTVRGDLNADAIAFATLTYAMDTASVNGGSAAAA
jgi:hypothetical protein